jgi:hypothetical protein
MRLNELNSYLADSTRLSPETLPAVRQLYESYPYCGVFAFLYLYNLALAEDVRYPSELRRLAVLLPDRERLFRLVEAQKEHFTPVEEAESEEDTFSLIDSFLEGVRSTGEDLPESLHLEVPAEVGDYFSGQDFAQVDMKDEELLSSRSVKEQEASQATKSEEVGEDSLLSETLSKIYIQQGHYDKALRIIRSLSLNYPEKSRFFADQIRFLERIIENNTIAK